MDGRLDKDPYFAFFMEVEKKTAFFRIRGQHRASNEDPYLRVVTRHASVPPCVAKRDQRSSTTSRTRVQVAARSRIPVLVATFVIIDTLAAEPVSMIAAVTSVTTYAVGHIFKQSRPVRAT